MKKNLFISQCKDINFFPNIQIFWKVFYIFFCGRCPSQTAPTHPKCVVLSLHHTRLISPLTNLMIGGFVQDEELESPIPSQLDSVIPTLTNLVS